MIYEELKVNTEILRGVFPFLLVASGQMHDCTILVKDSILSCFVVFQKLNNTVCMSAQAHIVIVDFL